jgi:hypothetical protein
VAMVVQEAVGKTVAVAVKEVLCHPVVLRTLLLHGRQWVCGSVAFLVLAHSTEQAAAVFALSHRRVRQSQRRCSVDGHSVGVLLRRSAGFGQGVGVRA